LLKYDDRDRLVGDVATDVPTLQNGGISRDGLTIVYHLRRDAHFADGVKLTARDCVWSIQAVLNPANNVQTRFGYDRIANASAVGDDTLVLRLNRPFAPILTSVLAPQGFPILPEHLLARYPDFNHLAFNQKPIGSGPYVVDAWLHGDRVEMHANPKYFLGEPKIRKLVVRFIPDPQEATNQLQTHEIQAYFNEQDYAQYPQLRALRGYYVLDRPVSAVGALIFNTQHPAVGDPAVRHAMAEAIDLDALVRKSYGGALDARAAGRGLFLWAFDPRRYPDVSYDPAAARAVLAARHRPFSVLLAIQAGVLGEAIAADQIAQYERAAGVRVSIKQYNVTQFGAPTQLGGPIYGGKFDMALYSFVNGDDPDTTDQFACAAVPPNGYNKSRICDRRLDALLYAGAATYVTGTRKQIYARLQSMLYARLPIVLLYQRRELDAFDKRLRGPSGSIDCVFWNVARWRWAQG
ncbi:MAG TPA: ABC transporter substrate-binding protein, partial [Candidatus Baltobacteraceae bacterium]|nr:ABC transporter substrate-binding protein [Candidatus Baltobacteraceae bacterium]